MSSLLNIPGSSRRYVLKPRKCHSRRIEIPCHHVQMIMVASPSKPFTYNIKGYPKRTIILRDYHDDIEALYAQVEQTAQSDVSGPQTWDVENTRAFVRTVVQRVVQRSLSDDADFFRNGCDRYAHHECDVPDDSLHHCVTACKQHGFGTPSFARRESTPEPRLSVCT